MKSDRKRLTICNPVQNSVRQNNEIKVLSQNFENLPIFSIYFRENKEIVTNLMITNLKSAFEASENIFYNHRKWTTWQNMAEKYIERVENLKNQTVSLIKKKQSDIA